MNVMEKILSLTLEDADCLRWRGGCSNSHPAMRHEGKTQLVRRLVWVDANGPIPTGMIIRANCETHDCVCIEHLELTTYQKVAKACGALGLMSGPLRTARISAVKQKTHGKITMEIAEMIRNSEETGVALSLSIGVPQSKISKIRRNQAWRAPVASHWIGLGARRS